MQPRYFIGLTLPDGLTRQIDEIRSRLLAGHKIMEPLVPHITLLHPNVLMSVPRQHVIPRMQQLASEHLPFKVELTHTGLFDQRVLYIAVSCPELTALRKALIGLLPENVQASYEIGRQFTPHVTIAQAKPMQKLPETLIEDLAAALNPLLPVVYKAEKLYSFVWVRPRLYKVAALT